MLGICLVLYEAKIVPDVKNPTRNCEWYLTKLRDDLKSYMEKSEATKEQFCM